MSSILEKATTAALEATEKAETHFRRTIKWHKEELAQAYNFNFAKMEEFFEERLTALSDKLTLQEKLHEEMIKEMKEAHNTEISNINKIHQKNMEEISPLQAIERKLEKKITDMNTQKPEDPPLTPDQKFAQMLERKPLNCTKNRTHYAPPPIAVTEEPESYILKTLIPQRPGFTRETFIQNQKMKDSNIKFNKIYNAKAGTAIIEVPNSTEGQKLYYLFHTIKEFKEVPIGKIEVPN